MSRFYLVKKIKNNFFLRVVAAYLLYFFIRILFFTYRLNFEDCNKTGFKEGVFYFWHQNIVAVSFFFFKKNLAGHCVISPSRDGQVMAFVAEKLGFTVLYGSSHKRSVGLLRDALNALENYKRLAIVGDGSRGPIFKLQRGIVYLAGKSKIPLVFVECKSSNPYIFKKSWDKFQLPLPFSKIFIKVHSPVMLKSNEYKNF